MAEGATTWTSSCPLPKNGFFIAPTIFTDATPSMRIAREEIFGPVLTTMTFRTPDEAVTKANNSAYGLSAGVWTEKGSRAMGMAAALRAGVIWDNTFNRFDPAASFGGYKESGFGREGGPSGMAAYLDTDDEAVTRSESSRGRQDLQAVHRRRVPALGVGPHLPGAGRRRRVPGQRGARPPARTPGTRWSPPARVSAPGPRPRRTTAGR